MEMHYLLAAAESLAFGRVVHDEGIAFVVSWPQTAPTEASQGCARHTARGGLALTQARRHGTSRARAEGKNIYATI